MKYFIQKLLNPLTRLQNKGDKGIYYFKNNKAKISLPLIFQVLKLL